MLPFQDFSRIFGRYAILFVDMVAILGNQGQNGRKKCRMFKLLGRMR
jgi:hypothetical protein